MKKKNGAIELLRFAFCMAVLVHHVSLDVFGRNYEEQTWGGMFRYGALGVEFFFICSGFFMAKGVVNDTERSLNICQTWAFIWKKLKVLLPYHIIVNIMMMFAKIVFGNPTMDDLVGGLASLFFLPTIGFNNHTWLLGAEWYVGYMIFAMIIIYPVLRKWPQFTVSYISPLVGIILFGYLDSKYGSVMETDRMIRAIGGIFLGIAAYGISERINKVNVRKIRLFVSIYPFAVIVIFFIYMNSVLSRNTQPFMVIVLWSALIITFSEKGFLSKRNILNNRFVYWLGKISLPVYIVQNFTREVVKKLLSDSKDWLIFSFEMMATVVFGIGLYYTLIFINKRIHLW